MRDATELARIAGWLGLLAIAVLTLLPGDSQPRIRSAVPKEVLEYSAYMLTSGTLALGYRGLRARIVLAACFPPYAMALQVAQSWVPGRTATIEDFLHSVVGAMLGILAAALVDRLVFGRPPD
jgi:VanZ family protein